MERDRQPVPVEEARIFGWWIFLRIAEPSELGAKFMQFFAEPADDEIRHGEYVDVSSELIAETKMQALRAGLDPSATLAAELARMETEEENKVRRTS